MDGGHTNIGGIRVKWKRHTDFQKRVLIYTKPQTRFYDGGKHDQTALFCLQL